MDSQEVYDNEEEDNGFDDEINGETNEKIRFELSQTPFEELLKLKEKLGTKVYNETIVNKMSENNGNKNRSKKCSFKRINKNRPQETSSKRPVSQFREVFQIKKNSVETERRDPRFDEKCGSFNEKVFKQTFSFLNDIKDKEMNDLKKLLKKTKNETKRKEIEYLLQRLQNQRTAQEEKEDKKERELEIRRTLAKESGNKLSFVNKSTLKRLELVEKFKRLKKSGKLEKYMEKKRKRNATRERKKIPIK